MAKAHGDEAHRAMLEQQAWIDLWRDQARAEQGSEGLRTSVENQSRKPAIRWRCRVAMACEHLIECDDHAIWRSRLSLTV